MVNAVRFGQLFAYDGSPTWIQTQLEKAKRGLKNEPRQFDMIALHETGALGILVTEDTFTSVFPNGAPQGFQDEQDKYTRGFQPMFNRMQADRIQAIQQPPTSKQTQAKRHVQLTA